MRKAEPFLIHNHTEMSNFRLKDSINKVEDLIDSAYEIGLDGICITDHEALSAHIRAFQHIQKHEHLRDFKIGYGNEIYLVHREEVEYKREKNERIQFYHAVLLAKDQKGYEGIQKLSTMAWKNHFYYRGMERVPLYYDELFEVMEDYKGHIIFSTACLGGFLPQNLLKSIKYTEWEDEIVTDRDQEIAKHNINWFFRNFKKVFGDDLYIELQPGDREVQLIANKLLYKAAKENGVKPIITTDTHYLTKDTRDIHRVYLQSQQGSREVDEFYSTTYLMNREHLEENYFKDNKEMLNELIQNTREIYDKVEHIEFGQPTQITKAHIPETFKEATIFDPFLEDHPYIKKMINSKYKSDRYYMRLLEDGMIKLNQPVNKTTIGRIEQEVEQLYKLTVYFNQPMTGYFLAVKEIVDLIWDISFIAPGRGSAACYYTNYLLEIVQFSAIDYDLPYWRFLHEARGEEMPDIDLDSGSHVRDDVIQLIKDTYGHDNVLPIATYTTEGNANTILSVCRGLGIDNNVASNIRSKLNDDDLVVQFYGDEKKGKQPNKQLIEEVDKIKEHDLRKYFLAINGLISGRSQHASGVVIYNNGYINDGVAMMKTKKGHEVTCFNDKEVEFLGGLKIDILSTDALTRMMTTMDLLVDQGEIDWQGSLRKTYDKYLHPDVIDYKDQDMYDLLYSGDIISLFQFSTNVGSEAIRKVNARDFGDVRVANSLMRLSVPKGEQPIDKYVRYGKNIDLWYQEMRENKLNDKEIELMEHYLLEKNGICDTQELLMQLSMEVGGYTLTEANKFRKLVANADKKALEKEYERFKESGKKHGSSDNLLEYTWKYCFEHQFG